jgi:peptide chain release factor 3
LGAVGPLQFDLVRYRLESEYGAASRIENTDWTMVRRISGGAGGEIDEKSLHIPMGAQSAADSGGGRVVLFPSDWHLRFFEEHNKGVELR